MDKKHQEKVDRLAKLLKEKEEDRLKISQQNALHESQKKELLELHNRLFDIWDEEGRYGFWIGLFIFLFSALNLFGLYYIFSYAPIAAASFAMKCFVSLSFALLQGGFVTIIEGWYGFDGGDAPFSSQVAVRPLRSLAPFTLVALLRVWRPMSSFVYFLSFLSLVVALAINGLSWVAVWFRGILSL